VTGKALIGPEPTVRDGELEGTGTHGEASKKRLSGSARTACSTAF